MNYSITRNLFILFLIIPLLWKAVFADQLVKPVDTKNNHILYISHLFIPAEGSSQLDKGSNDISLNIMKSSTNFDRIYFSYYGQQGNYDVETTSVILNYTRQIDQGTQVKVMLPFYSHSGGFMDHYIERFHGAFPGGGLKNGGREFAGRDEIHIQYRKTAGGPDINEPFYGIGDPSFFLKRVLVKNNPGITLSLGIKPEAGHKAFINSNTTDIGASINADYHLWVFNIYAMAGYSYFYGKGIYRDELEQYRNYILSSAAGAGVNFPGSLYFSVQFYCHSSIYDTGVKKVDAVTVINSYSLRWRVYDGIVLQLCADEDTFTYAAADIALSLRCEYTF